MSLLVVLLVVLGVLLGVGALTQVPVHRWRFGWAGHELEVRNYVHTERFSVDGQQMPSTRTGGDGLTWAEHELRLPHQPPLRVRIETRGFVIHCAAYEGDTLVFDSQAGPRSAEPTDERLAAARVLLRDLAQLDPQGAAELERALQQVLQAEQEARQRAAAHSALGGDAHELVEEARGEVELVLGELRKLHLSMDSGVEQAREARREAVARMGAAREVARMGRKESR
jgi:hypothetical protein